MGRFQATTNRSNAFTSLSCGCASIGSKKKKTISISPDAIMAPICWSPPNGPLNTFVIFRSSASSINLPVVPVATSLCFAKAFLLYVAHSIKSFFLLSCAISAIFFSFSKRRICSFMIFVF